MEAPDPLWAVIVRAKADGSMSGGQVKYQYRFSWDPAKAATNRKKHGVSFEQAATVFRDPLAISDYDSEHSGHDDERWITLGQADNGSLLVVVHTFEETDNDAADIRLISVRVATRNERRHYEGR